jgi:hypothetical protein
MTDGEIAGDKIYIIRIYMLTLCKQQQPMNRFFAEHPLDGLRCACHKNDMAVGILAVCVLQKFENVKHRIGETCISGERMCLIQYDEIEFVPYMGFRIIRYVFVFYKVFNLVIGANNPFLYIRGNFSPSII